VRVYGPLHICKELTSAQTLHALLQTSLLAIHPFFLSPVTELPPLAPVFRFPPLQPNPDQRFRIANTAQLHVNMRGSLGLATGLGWSDSEDEDAPSLPTRQSSAAKLLHWSHRRAREVMTRVASDDQADVS
jgi:hypothetical protein